SAAKPALVVSVFIVSSCCSDWSLSGGFETSEARLEEEAQDGEVPPAARDRGRHLALRIPPRGRQLAAEISQLGCAVVQVRKKLVSAELVTERCDTRINQQPAAVGAQALRRVSPVETRGHAEARRVDEPDRKIA